MKPAHMVLRPSPKLTYLLAGVTFVACLILSFLPLIILVKLGLSLLVLSLSLYVVLRDVLLALPHSCQSLALNGKDEIIFVQKNGKAFVCRVLPDSVVFAGLTVLRLKLEGVFWTRSLVLVADSADAEVFRRWRVWLKWGIKWVSSPSKH